MRRIFTVLTVLAAVGAGASPAVARGPWGTIKIGLWSGGAYTDDKSGEFTHCSAVAPYRSGTALSIGQNVGGQWIIGIGDPSANRTLGETLPVEATFDGRAHLRLFGSVPSPQLIFAVVPNPALLRKSHLLVVEINGSTYQFALTSAERVMAAVANCVAKTKVAGVANAGDFAATLPKPVVQTAPAAETAKQPPKSTKTVERTGTGFLVSTSGHVITNFHVIDGCVGDISGNLTGEPSGTLRVVSTDEINDLALLQASKTFDDVAVIRATPVRSGDAIIAIGFPFHGLLTSDFTVTTGIVSSLSGIFNDTRHLQISAGVQSGNSGGPLFDTSGNVVGVVVSKLDALKTVKVTGDMPQNINFAIKTGAMRDFLDNSVVP